MSYYSGIVDCRTKSINSGSVRNSTFVWKPFPDTQFNMTTPTGQSLSQIVRRTTPAVCKCPPQLPVDDISCNTTLHAVCETILDADKTSLRNSLNIPIRFITDMQTMCVTLAWSLSMKSAPLHRGHNHKHHVEIRCAFPIHCVVSVNADAIQYQRADVPPKPIHEAQSYMTYPIGEFRNLLQAY